MNNDQLKFYFDKIRNGDKNAFEKLYSDMKIPLYTIIYRITKNKEQSEDVLHDLFIKLYQSPPLPSVNNFRAYIFKMAHNLALNSIRKLQTEKTNDNLNDEAVQDDIITQIDVSEAMKRLPSIENEIVSLHLYGDLKFKEISKILELPMGTVLWRYRKAIHKMRDYLKGEITL